MIEAKVVPWAPGVPEPEECRQLVALLCDGEREVLELLSIGYTPQQAARVRGSSLSTVRRQIFLALQKMNVSGHYQGMAVLRRAELA